MYIFKKVTVSMPIVTNLYTYILHKLLYIWFLLFSFKYKELRCTIYKLTSFKQVVINALINANNIH